MNNSKKNEYFTDMLERIVELLTPNNCFICNSPSGLVCDACLSQEINPSSAVCYSCASRSDNFQTCKKCKKLGSKPDFVYHLSEYDGYAKQLIYKMKFDSTREAARIVGSQIADFLPPLNIDLVVPVPTATQRVRQRGYDHVFLMAKIIARQNNWQIAKLLKKINQSRQLGTSKSVRRRQALGSLALTKNSIKPKAVLIVDDVISSGATIEATTKLLRQNGATKVYAAVYARNLSH